MTTLLKKRILIPAAILLLALVALATPQGRLVQQSVMLAAHLALGGGLELSAPSVLIGGQPSSARVILCQGERGLIDVKQKKFGVILIVDGKWWLHLPKSRLTIEGDDKIPAFDLGDPAVDVIPLEGGDFRGIAAWEALKLPFLAFVGSGVQSAPEGFQIRWNKGKTSAGICTPAFGRAREILINGISGYPGTVSVTVSWLSADHVRESLKVPGSFTEDPARVRRVSTALLQRCVEGLVSNVVAL